MSVGGKVVRKRRKATEGTHLEFSPTPGVFVAPASTHTSRERPPFKCVVSVRNKHEAGRAGTVGAGFTDMREIMKGQRTGVL
ncbi:hypothetical protein NQZ68_029062 [Dissostichus eleginoides]|nr:hypothetical protein NQZ68_029062 [Dissostichus eleginoides]